MNSDLPLKWKLLIAGAAGAAAALLACWITHHAQKRLKK